MAKTFERKDKFVGCCSEQQCPNDLRSLKTQSRRASGMNHVPLIVSRYGVDDLHSSTRFSQLRSQTRSTIPSKAESEEPEKDKLLVVAYS